MITTLQEDKMQKLILVLMVLALVAGCNSKPEGEPPVPMQQQETVKPTGLVGTVLEAMDSGGYTYALMQILESEVWVAGPVSELEIGTEYEITNPMLMNNFHSKTMDKTFDEIYFISGYITPGSSTDVAVAQEMQTAHANLSEPESELSFDGISVPDAGFTVSHIIENRADLAGKTVTLRAKVVKASANIMNLNWLHLRDGSGADGSNDLTITSDDMAKVGDTVLVTGLVTVDKDFGAGYFYKVILEEASITVE
jgi:hypothetical protein